ncbi:hypothetical protein Tco_1157298, partial [Tanacetum coccineum]
DIPRRRPHLMLFKRSNKRKGNLTPIIHKTPNILNGVAFKEDVISRFDVNVARGARNSHVVHTMGGEVKPMR